MSKHRSIGVMGENDWTFWAASVAILISFLYYKVWPRTRKIIRLFGGIRLNRRDGLSGAAYKKVSVGALYALQQGAYVNSLTLGIDDKLSNILGHWWGISTAGDARETLEGLCQKGFGYYFPFVYQAYLLDDEELQDQVFQQEMTCQQDYDQAVRMLYSLQDAYRELVGCSIVASKEDISRYGVAGWDAGIICFLARACHDAGYISEVEAWQYLDKAYELAHKHFASWHDMAMSFLIGRAMWGGSDTYIAGMKSLADTLLTKPKSPWVQLQW